MVEGLMTVLYPNVVVCNLIMFAGLFKIYKRFEKKVKIPKDLEADGFLAQKICKIQNTEYRLLLYKVFKFIPFIMVFLIDGIDITLDTLFFKSLMTPGGPEEGAVVNKYLQTPSYVFVILSAVLIASIGHGIIILTKRY